MEKQAYFHGTGRRKTAIAQVKLLDGNGAIIVNGAAFEKYFPSVVEQNMVLRPLTATETTNKYNIIIKVTGGGVIGQSGAIAHGIARALVQANEGFKTALRQRGLLTRDPRIKERKKVGLKRARKAPQYTKR
ncbi:MAG: 30S ribosomal protein S9 [Chloroflexi bacterium]|nr:30S ribosomal protein S9 [Chloroflexota bacterium]